MSETSNDRFTNANLVHALDTPVRGGETRSPEEINQEAARIAAANDLQEVKGPGHRVEKKPMSKGAKLALKIIAPVAAVGLAAGGAAIATDGFNFKSSTTQGGTDNGEGTTGGNGGIEGNTITIEISPESLAGLSTPEQISEALSIPTTNEAGQPLTQAEFATELEESLEGLLNSGTTDEEFAPYENTPIGEYENALSAKYDVPALSAVFVDPGNVRWISENHKGNLLMSKTARLLGDEDFRQNVDITLADPANENAPAAGAEMTIDITYLSNAEEIGLVDFYSGTPQDIEGIDRTARYTVSVVDDGNGHLKSQLNLVEG